MLWSSYTIQCFWTMVQSLLLLTLALAPPSGASFFPISWLRGCNVLSIFQWPSQCYVLHKIVQNFPHLMWFWYLSHFTLPIVFGPLFVVVVVCFLGPHQQYMVVPRLGVKLELKLPPYTTAHGKARSLTYWVGPGIQPASSWILVGFVTTEPQWKCQYWPSYVTFPKTAYDIVIILGQNPCLIQMFNPLTRAQDADPGYRLKSYEIGCPDTAHLSHQNLYKCFFCSLFLWEK